jgi:hypothetical protein
MNLYARLHAITATPDAPFLTTPQGLILTYGDLETGTARPAWR